MVSRASLRLIVPALFLLMFLTDLFSVDLLKDIKVGFVDKNVIYTSFFGESRGARELDARIAAYNTRLEQFQEEIEKLELERIDTYLNAGSGASNIVEYDKEITNRRQFLREFSDLNKIAISAFRDRLAAEDDFFGNMSDAISLVASSRGYSMILDAEGSMIVWYSPEHDITYDVMRRLFAIYHGN